MSPSDLYDHDRYHIKLHDQHGHDNQNRKDPQAWDDFDLPWPVFISVRRGSDRSRLEKDETEAHSTVE